MKQNHKITKLDTFRGDRPTDRHSQNETFVFRTICYCFY